MSAIHQHKIYDISVLHTFTDKFDIVLYEGGGASEPPCRHSRPCVRGYLSIVPSSHCS